MKTLKNLFGNKRTKKTISSSLNQLDFNTMLIIKGGDNPDDTWPPTGTSNGK